MPHSSITGFTNAAFNSATKRFAAPPSSPTLPHTGSTCIAVSAEPVYRLSIRHFRCPAGASGVATTHLNHQGDASPHCGGRARAEWSGQSECESAEPGQVVIGRHWRQRGSRHGSAWCDLRRRRFRRARTSRRCGRAAGDRADGHDNDTSARAVDQRGDPERDRDHAIGLRASYPTVVAAGSTRRTGLCPVTLRLVYRYCARAELVTAPCPRRPRPDRGRVRRRG
jgi:hypothetical protein